jgi:hypothetical protein
VTVTNQSRLWCAGPWPPDAETLKCVNLCIVSIAELENVSPEVGLQKKQYFLTNRRSGYLIIVNIKKMLRTKKRF